MKGTTIIDLIKATLSRLGEATTSQIVAEMGHHISAAKASSYARNGQKGETVTGGKKRMVNQYLCEYAKRGEVVRVRRGVYSLAKPKLYSPQPETKSA